MSSSTIIIDYLGQGLHSARPTTPNIPTGSTAVYAETDTGNTYLWRSGAWALIAGSLATGINQLTADVLAGPGGGSQAATISAGAVTNAKMATMAAHTLKANITGSSAPAQDAAASDVATMLAPFLPGSIFFLPLTKTANYTIVPPDSSTVFNNIGATSDIVLTLPAAAAGLWYGVAVVSAHYVRVNAVGSNTISLGTSTSAAGGYVRSNAPVSVIILQAHDTTGWRASSIVGAWGVDGAPPSTGGGSGGTAVATVGDTFPASPVSGQLHWLSTDGQLYIRYGTAWVIANTAPSALPAGTSANDNLIYDGSVWGAQRPRYGLAFSYVGGLLGASQLLGIHCFTKAVTFNANFSGWLGHTPEAGGTASATASTVITVERALVASPNSWSGVGTITIAAGSINPSFATTGGAAVNFAVGDRMRLVGPSTPDSTFQNFYCSLVGREA